MYIICSSIFPGNLFLSKISFLTELVLCHSLGEVRSYVVSSSLMDGCDYCYALRVSHVTVGNSTSQKVVT